MINIFQILGKKRFFKQGTNWKINNKFDYIKSKDTGLPYDTIKKAENRSLTGRCMYYI